MNVSNFYLLAWCLQIQGHSCPCFPKHIYGKQDVGTQNHLWMDSGGKNGILKINNYIMTDKLKQLLSPQVCLAIQQANSYELHQKLFRMFRIYTNKASKIYWKSLKNIRIIKSSYLQPELNAVFVFPNVIMIHSHTTIWCELFVATEPTDLFRKMIIMMHWTIIFNQKIFF